jgi:hypothetical protein
VKSLGIHLDSDLKWKCHLKYIEIIILKYVRIMNPVKYKLESNVMLTLYNSLILPYLGYCCVIGGDISIDNSK